jgi:hypothetical protein
MSTHTDSRPSKTIRATAAATALFAVSLVPGWAAGWTGGNWGGGGDDKVYRLAPFTDDLPTYLLLFAAALALGVGACAAARAIIGRRILSPWLMAGGVPAGIVTATALADFLGYPGRPVPDGARTLLLGAGTVSVLVAAVLFAWSMRESLRWKTPARAIGAGALVLAFTSALTLWTANAL